MRASVNLPVVPLAADSVSFRRQGRWILTAATLTAPAGAITVLVGRNGAGKTTLLRILAGDLASDGGTVRVDGAPLERPNRAMLARKGVGLLAARDVLHPRMSVREQLTSVAARGTNVAQVMDTLRLTALARERPRSLSGGERRRAELAAILLMAPRVLLADEPLRGMAPLDAALMLAALRAFVSTGGAAVLTGHELPLLEDAVDRVVWCYAGTTRAYDAFSDARDDRAFAREFLGRR